MTFIPSIKPRLFSKPRKAGAREQGAFAVVTAMTVVGLLGMGAIVIDIGMAWQERRELQNGADAAALAATLDCVHGDCGNPNLTEQNYGNYNASDNLAHPDRICGFADSRRRGGLVDCADPVNHPTNALGWIKVESSTLGENNKRTLSFGLARALGAKDASVGADSYSAWGAPAKLKTSPLMISQCVWDQVVAGDGTNVPEYPLRSEEVTVWNNRDTRAINGSGQDCGYSFLRNFNNCRGTAWVTSSRDWLDVTTTQDGAGKDLSAPPNDCPNSTWLEGAQEFDIPVYESTITSQPQDCGPHKAYKIVGYTNVKITSYKFSETSQYGNPDCGDGYCMKVKFSRVVRKWETNFAGEDFGVISYRLFDPANPDAQAPPTS